MVAVGHELSTGGPPSRSASPKAPLATSCLATGTLPRAPTPPPGPGSRTGAEAAPPAWAAEAAEEAAAEEAEETAAAEAAAGGLRGRNGSATAATEAEAKAPGFAI